MCSRDKQLHTRIVSSTSRGASRWLSTSPNDAGHQIGNEQFALAVRQRLHVRLFDDMPTTCECGANLTRSDQIPHMHWCKRVKAPSTALRHNHIVTTIDSLAQLAGVTTRVELTQPTYDALLSRTRKLRPDLLLIGSSATYLVDVACCHPLSPSRVARGMFPRNDSDRTLRAIVQLEQAKTNKYHRLATRLGHQFLPFACDVYGAIGKRGHDLISWLAREGAACGRLSDTLQRQQFTRLAYARLSIAIQRATAICAVDGARRIRDAASVRARV
jgi:hypothetical protein